jgi:hypothetical protein
VRPSSACNASRTAVSRHHVRDVQVAEPPAGGLADGGPLPGDQIVISDRLLARQRNHDSPPERDEPAMAAYSSLVT